MPTRDAETPVEVDARGMRCPWPVLRAARAMRDASACVILADDPKAEGEIAGLAQEHGWQVMAVPGGWHLQRG